MGDTLTLFNIQRYSLHDGDGIRTVFFLKGCPLHCLWCCNPESQEKNPQIMFRRGLCIGVKDCGRCITYCKEKNDKEIEIDEDGTCKIDVNYYKNRFDYCDICPAGVFERVGKEYDIEELLDIGERDAAFYGGDGGITLSGGEPLAQENSLILLKKAKKERFIRTAVETCGEVPKDRLLEASKYLDQIFIDIKSADEKKHKRYTGSDGKRIKENLLALVENYPRENITVRTPVIPGFNDDKEELLAIEEFLDQLGDITWQKLPYHEYGKGKYEMLGKNYFL